MLGIAYSPGSILPTKASCVTFAQGAQCEYPLPRHGDSL